MICVAAFAVLLVIVLFVPVIRIFSKKRADQIWKLFKKATHCVGRRTTFRACDSSFSDDVKHSLLRKVILKHPKWVKPLSILIEILSVVIILVTIWSLLVIAKSGVSLFVYGTCDVETPSACVLDGSESCTIDAVPVSFSEHPIQWTGNWFAQFGEALAAIPTRLKTWDAADYKPENANYFATFNPDKPTALDVFDPSCIVCQRSYLEQKKTGFFAKYNTTFIAYPIPGGASYKFPHSRLLVQYIEAVRIQPPEKLRGELTADWALVDHIFTGKTDDGDTIQNAFNLSYDQKKAREIIEKWLAEIGYSEKEIAQIREIANGEKVAAQIKENSRIVEKEIKTKKIPTMLYDGKRHDGQFKAE